MTLYINSPQWFQGIDATIELLAIVVAFLIAGFGYKIYRITRQKNYQYFSISFLLMGISFIFKIISELVIYSSYIEQKIIGPYIISRTVTEPITWIHTYAHSTFKVLATFAFFILLAVTLKIHDKKVLFLLTYFMAAITLASIVIPFLFHLTHIMILALLVHKYYHNYLENQKKQALMVTLAFLAIFASHIMFLFMLYDPNLYAIGLVMQLAGFILLLYTFILVKKTKNP
ncbi:hypothetical protein KY362_00295 [Candidatus Woesearchaeota archaeon]|nr:hypothetical protein [Candidatus Woesearchaeota archaeon]